MFVPSISSRTICTVVFVAALILISATTYHLGLADDLLESVPVPWPRPDGGGAHHGPGPNLTNFQGPAVPTSPQVDAKVVGLVFYGRRELVRVLDCYLKVRLHLRPNAKLPRAELAC